MKKRKPKVAQTYVLRYEMFEAERVMNNRIKSAYQCNHSLGLYQRAYKGNAIRLLLSRSQNAHKWVIKFATTGKDYNTGLLTSDPHVLSLAINTPCPLSQAVIAAGEHWAKYLMPELARLTLDPIAVHVEIRSINTK